VGQESATLKDVAAAAGVSTATVARVVHGRGYVASETREQVQSAIRTTGYQLNAVAQGLRTRRTLVLGHLLLAISPNPFFANIALGVEGEAARRGCGVIIANTQQDPELERLAVETLIRRRVDAIIFTTVRDEQTVHAAIAASIPVVQVERSRLATAPSVTIDNYQGAFEATSHLVALGHRRVAFIGEDPDRWGAHVEPGLRLIERERLDGYRDALVRHGLPIDPAFIDLGGRYYDLDHTRMVTGRWLDNTTPPTAIFAACDFMAAGVLQEAYARGLHVPRDLSVVGFDDTLAAQLTPPLTTVVQPMIETGRLAAAIAIEAAEAQNQSPGGPRVERLTTHLVVRESTEPPAAHSP
jgi:LacI family transcriptional regulator